MIVAGQLRHDLFIQREVVEKCAPEHDVLGRALGHVTVRHVVQSLRVFALLKPG